MRAMLLDHIARSTRFQSKEKEYLRRRKLINGNDVGVYLSREVSVSQRKPSQKIVSDIKWKENRVLKRVFS